jgi:type VI secretion system secreted protein Hcp
MLSLVVGAAALINADANAAGPLGFRTGGPITAYVKFTGQRSGVIDGDVTVKGHEKQSLVLAIDHNVTSPRDPQSGLPTGKRQHSPLVITKPIYVASPKLENVLFTNENLKTVEIDLVQAGQTFYKYVLTNASISDFHQSMTTSCVGSGPCKATGSDGNIVGPDEPTETIAMTYQKIEVVYTPGGVAATDDWEARQ